MEEGRISIIDRDTAPCKGEGGVPLLVRRLGMSERLPGAGAR